MQKNPVFLYYTDNFKRPNPFRPDIVVDIDDVVDQKLAALETLESQFYEGGALGHAGLIPKDAAGETARRAEVKKFFLGRATTVAEKYRDKLVAAYGKERGAKVGHAEAFEICEYGAQPKDAEIRRLFPFFGE